jgi:hypothetical protein
MFKVRLATFFREISTSIFPDVGLRTPESPDTHVQMTIRQIFTLVTQDDDDSKSDGDGENESDGAHNDSKSDDDGENESDGAPRCYINALHFPLPGDSLAEIPRAR